MTERDFTKELDALKNDAISFISKESKDKTFYCSNDNAVEVCVFWFGDTICGRVRKVKDGRVYTQNYDEEEEKWVDFKSSDIEIFGLCELATKLPIDYTCTNNL